MATCESLTLKLEQDKISCFTNPYVLKLSLIEGISAPLCARMIVLSDQGVPPKTLKGLIGLKAFVTIAQNRGTSAAAAAAAATDSSTEAAVAIAAALTDSNISQRYAAGHIISASFIQKVPGEHPVFVYELMMASAISALCREYHQRTLHHTELATLLKTLLTLNKSQEPGQSPDPGTILADQCIFDLAALPDNYDHNHININQDNVSNYQELIRLLQLYGLNYFIIPNINTLSERLLITSVLPDKVGSIGVGTAGAVSSPSILPALDTPDRRQQVTSAAHYDCSEPYSVLQDLKYSFTQKALSTAAPENSTETVPDSVSSRLNAAFGITINHNDQTASTAALNERLQYLAAWNDLVGSEQITASARDLAFTPGFRFTESSTGDELNLMVVKSSLLAIAPFPKDRAIPALNFKEKTLALQLELFNENNTIDNLWKSFYLGCFAPDSSAPVLPLAELDLLESRLISSVAPISAAVSRTGSAVNAAAPTAAVTGAAITNSLSRQEERLLRDPSPDVHLVNATICTEQGSAFVTSSDGKSTDYSGLVYLTKGDDRVSHPDSCYAVLEGDTQKEPVVVECLSLWGDGLTLPRVGNKIKVLKIRGQYLYFGQMGPTQTLPVKNENKNEQDKSYDDKIQQRYDLRWQENELYSRVLQNVLTPAEQKRLTPATTTKEAQKPYALGTGSQAIPVAEMGLRNFNNRNDWLFYYYRHGLLDRLAQIMAVSANSADISSEYKNKLKPALDQAAAAYENALKNSKVEQISLDSAVLKAANTFYDKLNDVGKLFFSDQDAANSRVGDNPEPHTDLVFQTPVGNITLGSSEGSISMVSPTIRANGDTCEISCKKMLISADESITFSVGGNSVGIDRNGTSMVSRKWQSAPGLFDTYIYMDGISGISIGGLNTSINSMFGTSISDAFGSSLSLCNGTAALAGRTCSINTSDLISAIKDTIHILFTTLTSTADLITGGVGQHTLSDNGRDTAYKAYSGIYYTEALIKSVIDIDHGIFNTIKSWSSYDSYQKIIDCFNIVQQIILAGMDFCENTILYANPDLLNRSLDTEHNSNFTVRDLMRVLNTATKLIVTTTVYFVMEGSFIMFPTQTCSLSMNPKGSQLSSNEIRFESDTTISCNTPMSTINDNDYQGMGNNQRQQDQDQQQQAQHQQQQQPHDQQAPHQQQDQPQDQQP